MNVQLVKSAWRRWKKPSRQTLETTGAKVDYWPEYQPRRARTGPLGSIGALDDEYRRRLARCLESAIGSNGSNGEAA